MTFHTLSLDIETYSPEDLKKTGTHKYAAHPEFGVLWCAYKRDIDEDVTWLDIYSHGWPKWLVRAIVDPTITKVAWNAAFERTALAAELGKPMPAEQWDCTMVRAARAGWPLSLDVAARAMGLTQQKDKLGTSLINYFSKPCKPSKVNGGRTRNLPEHSPEKWQQYGEYCAQDVRAESAIRDFLISIPVSEFEQKLWCVDQRINDRGIKVDVGMVQNAIRIYNNYSDILKVEANEITGLHNSNSNAQLRAWLIEQGQEVENLRKATVEELLQDLKKGDVRRVLEIKQEVSKTSVKKYNAVMFGVGDDERCKGLFQFYGANRTGRFSGRRLQLQNLPQNHLPYLDLARKTIVDGKGKLFEIFYGNVPDALSQLIRTALVPMADHKFIVMDLSSIELVCSAWLADEQWVIDEFNTTRKIYEQTAARMLNIPVSMIGPDSAERQKGKVAALACQYGGTVGALISMGALRMGLEEDALPGIAAQWREANPNIVNYWWKLNRAALQVVGNPGTVVELSHGIKFFMKRRTLYIRLPSGRLLAYVGARIAPGKFGKPVIHYYGTKNGRWTIENTYGPKFFENLCQAVSRDCLAEAMVRMDDAGMRIVSHVHDEVVLEVPHVFDMDEVLKQVQQLMTVPLDWAPGLPLAAKGFYSDYYKK